IQILAVIELLQVPRQVVATLGDAMAFDEARRVLEHSREVLQRHNRTRVGLRNRDPPDAGAAGPVQDTEALVKSTQPQPGRSSAGGFPIEDVQTPYEDGEERLGFPLLFHSSGRLAGLDRLSESAPALPEAVVFQDCPEVFRTPGDQVAL